MSASLTFAGRTGDILAGMLARHGAQGCSCDRCRSNLQPEEHFGLYGIADLEQATVRVGGVVYALAAGLTSAAASLAMYAAAPWAIRRRQRTCRQSDGGGCRVQATFAASCG